MVDQKTVFAQGEGDAWFARNEPRLAAGGDWEMDPALRLVARARLRPASTLEVGAANGHRLDALVRRFGCAATAVEPSARAVQDGSRRFPSLSFVRAEAHDLAGLADGIFDLVIVNFLLHWVDRAALMRSAAEIDRVLCDGGHLLVGDFAPATPERVAYHHLPGAQVWTFKQDYPAIWLATRLYTEVDGFRFHHATREIGDDIDPAHRAHVTLLRKNLTSHYRIAERT